LDQSPGVDKLVGAKKMSEQNKLGPHTADYKDWLKALKARVYQVQLKAAVTVNQELLHFYWELGADIVERQKSAAWGSGFLKQLSKDLRAEFPEMKGFSFSNIKHIRQWFLFYSNPALKGQQPVGQIGQQAVAQFAKQPVSQITQIPWGHNLTIISKCESTDEALYYVQNTLEYGWSRSVLTHQIESGLWQREGKAITNFQAALVPPQSDLATQTLKDPYVFDFLTLTKDHNERELEAGLVEHITHFLLELGAGFAYIGRQVPLQVGERDFFLDLLFYHTRLHCYVIVEIKAVDFEPEHAGKLNFYLKAVDEQLRREGDRASIGILLCKNRDKTVVEYALSDVHKPIGVSEYQLTKALPENLKSSLPSIEELEAELGSQELNDED
jgi:predicted nuclease of restriction endonuclease-like (RecB) superfamily